MNARTSGAIGIILCLSIYLSTVNLLSQERPDQPVLKYERSVTLKLIQIYVTDRSGNPIPDLTIDDFVVFDAGTQVKLTAFEKHGFPTATGENPPADATIDKPATLNRKFVLFFDFAFNNLRGVSASIAAALDFIKEVGRPGDEFAVISYSLSRGLRIHEFFTTDPQKATAAVTALPVKDIAGRAEDVETEYEQLAQLSNLGLTKGLETEVNRVEAGRTESKYQAQTYLAALTSLAKGLRLVQGQKNFIFFSTGVPNSLVYGNLMTITTNDSNPYNNIVGARSSSFKTDAGDMMLRPKFEALLKEWSASQCSLYIFDTRGSAKSTSLFGFDENQFAIKSGGMFSADGVGSAVSNPFRDEKTTGAGTLTKMAKETGGRYFSNILLYKNNLEDIQAATGVFYVVGYSVVPNPDGAFHPTKVQITRKGAVVRAQSGYFNPKPFREYTRLERDLQLFDLALNERSDIGLSLIFPVSALSYCIGTESRVKGLAKIPKELIERFSGGATELVAIFFDRVENVISLQRTTADLNKYRGHDIIFGAGMAVPPGAVTCRFVVRDLESGQGAVGSGKAFIAALSSAKLVVGTPLLLAPEETEISYLDGVTKGAADTAGWREIYPFDERISSPVIGGAQITSNKVTVVMPFIFKGEGEPDLVLSAFLVGAADGRNIPVSVLNPKRRLNGAIFSQSFEFDLSDMAPGDYTLYINVAERATNSQASGRVQINIKR